MQDPSGISTNFAALVLRGSCGRGNDVASSRSLKAVQQRGFLIFSEFGSGTMLFTSNLFLHRSCLLLKLQSPFSQALMPDRLIHWLFMVVSTYLG